MIEHLAKLLTGQGLLGPQADSELSHLLFNVAILLLSLRLVWVYPGNPWVYPLAFLAAVHGVEHVYIYQQYLVSGIANGPGLIGRRGALGLISIDRLQLHNIYNGLELVLMVLGFQHEFTETIAKTEVQGEALEVSR